jgi:uncharacterized membrane protein
MRQDRVEREGVYERANPSPTPSDPSLENKGSDPVGKTLNDIIKLESLEKTASERIAERIAGFTGSMFFVLLHVVWFSLWIGLNLPLLNSHPVDPFPFTFLTMIVSLEAIFLSAFILMTENRQARLSDRRARVNLQIDMIAEREVTKLMQLVVEIHSHLGISAKTDPELEDMKQATNIDHLTEAAQTIENRNGDLASEKEIVK